jgi:SAM-dependent methyltransferase
MLRRRADPVRDPTQRFSSRVENYARYRPGYPPELVTILETEGQLLPGDVVADIGSGTGKLAELFLRHGSRVVGVEPNPEMRRAGEERLARFSEFSSVAGRAEATNLDDRSVDLVVAGQAFHWFDPGPTRVEFSRVLRPAGRVMLVWNNRRIEATEFMSGYEQLLRDYGTDYARVNHQKLDESNVRQFFGPGGCRVRQLSYRQNLDLEGLRGRLLSSSYTPEPQQAGHAPMIEVLEKLFHRHAEHDCIELEYETKVFYGRLDSGGGA